LLRYRREAKGHFTRVHWRVVLVSSLLLPYVICSCFSDFSCTYFRTAALWLLYTNFDTLSKFLKLYAFSCSLLSLFFPEKRHKFRLFQCISLGIIYAFYLFIMQIAAFCKMPDKTREIPLHPHLFILFRATRNVRVYFLDPHIIL